MKTQYHHKKWLIMAPLGLVLTGFGLCLLTESALMKYQGAGTWHWTGLGALALVVFNSGLSIFGQSIIHKIRSLSSEQNP